MKVLEKESLKDCLNEILSSFRDSETEEAFEEKMKEIEKRYGKENTQRVAEALIAVLKEKK